MKIYDGIGNDTPDRAMRSASGWEGRRSVGVADYAVTVDGATLVTSGLGSCVAVGITDGEAVAGLLHVMLPSADGRTVDNPAKYADTGVQVLIDDVVATGAVREALRAKIAGGSEMIAFRSQNRSIGERNVEAVRTALERLDVPLVAEDVGGSEGRTVEFSSAGDLVVRSAALGRRTI